MLQVPPPQVSNRGRLDRVEQFKQLNNSIDSIEERKIIIEDASNSEFYKFSLRVNIESPKQARWLSVLKIENARKRSKSMNSNILNNNIFKDSKVVESKYYLRSEDLENIKLNCYYYCLRDIKSLTQGGLIWISVFNPRDKLNTWVKKLI